MYINTLPRIREPTAGLYGKIPAERDFVRINAGDFQHAALDQWFQEGVECLHTDRTRLPSEPAHFLLVAPNGDAFVGGFMPGEDAVGRNFPLVISVRLEARNLVEALPLPCLQSSGRLRGGHGGRRGGARGLTARIWRRRSTG